MGKKNIITSIIVVMTVTILVTLAFRVRIGATADAVAVLKTAGMTCSSCTSTIKSALEREKGVAATEVDLSGGWVIVGYDTKAVKPETLARKVSDSGYDSNLYAVLTPEEFKQAAGREFGRTASSAGGCGGCGTSGGGCGGNRQNQAQGE